jgi:cell division protein FtsB
VPLASRLSQAEAAATAARVALTAAQGRQGAEEVAAIQRAAAVRAFDELKRRRDDLRRERGELAQQIAERGMAARLAAAVHDPQSLRIDAIDAALLDLRSELTAAAPAAARAAAVPPPTRADVQASQAEMKRLRDAVAVAQAEVERIEREQRMQGRQQGPQQPGDYDRDR